MSKSVPIVAAAGLVAGNHLLARFDRGDALISQAGRFLSYEASRYQNYSIEPISLAGSRGALLEDLADLISEHRLFAWDGEQAPPVGSLTIARAKQFIAALPDDIQNPDLAVEPDDGSISMEWYGGYRQVASVSIGGTNRLAFAALQGTDVVNGAFRFSREELPQTVLTAIRQIMS